IMAAEAGKDLFSEKPMTRTIGEGLSLVDAVQRTGRMFRVNTGVRLGSDWYGSDMKAKEVKKLMMAGVFGSPVKVIIGKATGFDWKLDQWSGVPGLKPEQVPPELDYDMWLGPAPYKPYNVLRVH